MMLVDPGPTSRMTVEEQQEELPPMATLGDSALWYELATSYMAVASIRGMSAALIIPLPSLSVNRMRRKLV